jgi:hypothetical protein
MFQHVHFKMSRFPERFPENVDIFTLKLDENLFEFRLIDSDTFIQIYTYLLEYTYLYTSIHINTHIFSENAMIINNIGIADFCQII